MSEDLPELNEPKPKQGLDHAPLYVSLYIVILAFFILLNTMSTYEEVKAERVVESLKKTFAFDRPVTLEFDHATGPPSGSAKEEFFNAIEEYASRFIPVDQVKVKRGGDFIEIHVPMFVVFTGDSANLNPVNLNVMEGFVSAYRKTEEKIKVVLDVSVDARQESGLRYLTSQANPLTVMQAGALARYFELSGMAPSKLTAGLKSRDKNLVRYRFTVQAYPEEMESDS